MSVDIKLYKDRIRARREALGGDTYAHANKWTRVAFGVKVSAADLEVLIEMYEAAIAWRATTVHCLDDSYDRDEVFAEVVERLTSKRDERSDDVPGKLRSK